MLEYFSSHISTTVLQHGIEDGFIYHYKYFYQAIIIPLKTLFLFFIIYFAFSPLLRHTTLRIADNTEIK
jgi:hypothetical protein